MLDNPIYTAIKNHDAELIAIRRDIHAHPETAFEEVRTAALVAAKLRGWGIETHQGLGKTGVVGTIKGSNPGQRAVALRADMDALTIDEKNTFAHRSSIPGKMHACGHDGHTAMLLGAARYLAENPDFGGTVYLIFQPAEEGLGGAQEMVQQGLFDLFPADAVFGMHNKPGRPVGQFGIRTGPMLAASDTWTVTFHGTGGHGGSAAHLAADPTIPLANFILGLHTIIARNVAAIEPAVLSVGHIHCGAINAPNVIPADVTITGTARSFAPATRDLLERRVGELAASTAAQQGCIADYVFKRRYPPVINTATETQTAIDAAAALVGTGNVDPATAPSMGADDFAFMLENRPGAFISIGNGTPPDGVVHYLHTPYYDFNDDIIALGAAYWVTLVQHALA
jgi:hippurate hydrolase